LATPLSWWNRLSTMRGARDNLFVALADLLRAAAGRLQATSDQSDLDAHARAVPVRSPASMS